jgi:hypothetical protein
MSESLGLDAKIANAHIGVEKTEFEAKAIEEKIAGIYEIDPNIHIPSRSYGQPFDPSKLKMVAKHFIEKHDPHLASYLGINTGYHSRQAEIEEERRKVNESMAEQTEKLKYKNQQDKEIRHYRNFRGLNIANGERII